MTLDQQIQEARRDVAYRKHNLGFACTQVNRTARTLSGLPGVEGSRGARLLAELEAAKRSRAMNRETLAHAEATLRKLLAQKAAQS